MRREFACSLQASVLPIDGCRLFAGSYSRQTGNDDTFSSQGLQIGVNQATSTLEFRFNADLPAQNWNGWIESYLVDGASHKGDSNTGEYTIACHDGRIDIRRSGLLIVPIITSLTLQGNQLL